VPGSTLLARESTDAVDLDMTEDIYASASVPDVMFLSRRDLVTWLIIRSVSKEKPCRRFLLTRRELGVSKEKPYERKTVLEVFAMTRRDLRCNI